jgi:antitoxin component YwqK of YwqJK toxin-antitoxin module
MLNLFPLKKLIFAFIIFTLVSWNCIAQKIFYCDSASIKPTKDSLFIARSHYYYNFFTGAKDSVVIINGDTLKHQKILTIVEMHRNALNGPIKYFTSDSILFMQGFLKNGKSDSTFITYQVSMDNYKKVGMKSKFRNGLKDGEETEYSDKGTVIVVRNYKEGLLDGQFMQYDAYGNILSQGYYSKGKKEDAWIEKYPKERVVVTQNYKAGQLIDYNWSSYFSSGKLFIEGNYDKNGLKQGIFKIYDVDGSLQSTENYKDGKRNGFFIEYFNGAPVRKIKYKDDKIIRN